MRVHCKSVCRRYGLGQFGSCHLAVSNLVGAGAGAGCIGMMIRGWGQRLGSEVGCGGRRSFGFRAGDNCSCPALCLGCQDTFPRGRCVGFFSAAPGKGRLLCYVPGTCMSHVCQSYSFHSCCSSSLVPTRDSSRCRTIFRDGSYFIFHISYFSLPL